MTIFEAAAALRRHLEEKTKNMNILNATWDYAVSHKNGEIMKVNDREDFRNVAFIFRVVYRDGNIEIEQA